MMQTENNTMTTRTLEITLPAYMWTALDRLAEADAQLAGSHAGTVAGLVTHLLDHAQQGVRRPGAWERDWLVQCMGAEVVEEAEAEAD